MPQFGILARSPIGLLVLENECQAATMLSHQPGSRLKTPALPVWVTNCCGHYGVMYNSNRELLRNYHAEKRFQLHYYTCAGNYVLMTIDNRAQEDEAAYGGGATSSGNSSSTSAKDEVVASPITRLIHTKWADAKIAFKGPIPSSLLF